MKGLMPIQTKFRFAQGQSGGVVPYHGSLAARAAEVKNDHGNRNWECRSGHLSDLKSHLEVV